MRKTISRIHSAATLVSIILAVSAADAAPIDVPTDAAVGSCAVGPTFQSVSLLDVGTAATDAGGLVYSNTLGQSVLGVSAGTAGDVMADDIATTAVAGCILDRYVVKVSGDKDGDGSGVGPYSVDVALYETCPGASLGGESALIPNTDCHFEFDDNAVYAITCNIPSHIDVPLPANFYLGMRFSRGECGAVGGAPPTLGFSADQYDFPEWPCAAWLGGYPDFPHASFYAKIYVRDECDSAFVGYKNSMQAGSKYTLDGWFADDIHLGVPECDMVAYEVAVKGPGTLIFDLRTTLINNDPENGGVIPGTRASFDSSGDHVQIARVEIDPPVRLLPDLWIGFLTAGSGAGPIVTNQQASLGHTEDYYAVFDEGWDLISFQGQTPWAFDVTIQCAGSPNVGACCDMIFTDEDGEAVCRELPEMNCGFPEFWRDGASCQSACEGGVSDGQPCTRQADCPGYSCVGGLHDGQPCDPEAPNCPGGFCKRAKCPGPFPYPCGQSACCTHDDWCFNYTENECYAREPVDKPRLYVPGEYCNIGGFHCPRGACLGGEGDCTLAHAWPGCEDPWCCSIVCAEWDASCCLYEWDGICTSGASELCPDCPIGPITFVDPPDGVIDARRPYPPDDPTYREGIDKIVVEGPDGLDTRDYCWTFCDTKGGSVNDNNIAGLVDNENGTFDIVLERSISTGAVTTLTYEDDDGNVYMGVFTSHPANTNYDDASDAADVLAIIDYINGVDTPPWDIKYSADCDHSGVVGPADILCVIDLLNGADQFDPWFGESLPASR